MKFIWITFILLIISMRLVQMYLKNKTLRISLAIIITLITCYMVILSINISRVNSFRKPILMWESENYCTTKCTSYKGLGYKVEIKYYDTGIKESIILSMFGKVIAGGVQDIIIDDTFSIVDETKTCDQAIEPIYEDDYFIYSFSCIKSHSVFIVTDGNKISVKDALLDKEANWGKLITEKYPEMFIIEAKENENTVSCNTKDFTMTLNTNKKVYNKNEKIKIWTTLKYTGNKDNITIWHAGSAETDTYFNYFITDGKDFNLESVTTLMLKSTELKKNKLYYYKYEKSGGYGEEDAEFWEEFFKEKDLYLPLGNYTITASSGFGLSDSDQNIGLKCNLEIKVVN